MESFEISYGAERVRCHVLRSQRRRTLAIDVFPDLSVQIRAPLSVSIDVVSAKVQRRVRWITQKRSEFAGFGIGMHVLPILSGASVQLLGKRYRLKIERRDTQSVEIGRTDIHVAVPAAWIPDRVTEFLSNWERAKAAEAFTEIVKRTQSKLAHHISTRPRVSIKNMRTRWASMSRTGTLSLNPKLVRASSACIEYVVTHELCHLVHPNHGTEFVRLMSNVMPDWRERKRQLEQWVKT